LARFLDSARQELGGVHVLVHNASALAVGPDLTDWEVSLQVNLMAAVRACAHVVPWLAEAGGGSILFVSSISGLEVDPAPDYGHTAAKAALIAHAKKLAVMLAPQGIRVNAIAPGSTEFPGGIWANMKEPGDEFYAYLRNLIRAGFEDRIMFGSDQMSWPETIGLAISAIQSADFLTEQQKRNILYNNAARFLKLSPARIARHHQQ
jgi:3-oxoacyl-[acyl-carrier protein] reductase